MDKVTLNNKEQKRLMVLNEVLAGRLTGLQAAVVVDESLAALAGDRVIVVPGRQYRGIVATINSPFRGVIRRVARRVRQPWHSAKPSSGT